MREYEHITLAHYVTQALSRPEVQKMTESWRIDPEVIAQMIVDHFQEVGVFRVSRTSDPIMMQNILHFLKHSMELKKLVARAQEDEQRRRRTEHAR